jgi:hypothetical protein
VASYKYARSKLRNVFRHIIVVSIVIAILGLAISETTTATIGKVSLLNNDNSSQSDSTALNTTNTMFSLPGKKVIITWLETNGTNETNSPIINISNEDFWKAFGPLLK